MPQTGAPVDRIMAEVLWTNDVAGLRDLCVFYVLHCCIKYMRFTFLKVRLCRARLLGSDCVARLRDMVFRDT